jgi:tetratricopeptide (TPR) repeat protein
MARHSEAVEHLERAVSIDGRCAESRIRLALALSNAGRELEAIPEFRTAFELEPRNPQYQRNLAYSLARAGVESEEAVALLEQYVAAAPDDSAAMTGLATLLERVGRRDEAYVLFERATEVARADAHAFVELGLYQARAGNQVGAVAAFEKAIELKKDPDTFALLGGSFVGLDRLEEAEKAFQEGHRIDPDHQRNLAQLGAVLARRGALSEALPLLERAVALDGSLKRVLGVSSICEAQLHVRVTLFAIIIEPATSKSHSSRKTSSSFGNCVSRVWRSSSDSQRRASAMAARSIAYLMASAPGRSKTKLKLV